MQSISSRVWTRVNVSFSYDDNHYTAGTSYPGHVIPNTLEIVLVTSLPNTEQYKIHIKSKVEQSRQRHTSPPLHLGVVAIKKGAFWSPSTTVANYFLHRSVGVGATIFSGLFHFTLYTYLIMLSKAVSSTIFWVFVMILLGTQSWSTLTDTLTNWPIVWNRQ